MRTLLQDLRYALRSFRTARAGLILSVVVLAIATGAATTTYSVVSAVVLRSLPFAEPESLVNATIGRVNPDGSLGGGGTMSRQSVELVLSATEVFESAAYYYGMGDSAPVLTGLGEPERVSAWAVTPEFFAVLGSSPLLGRIPVAGSTDGTDAHALVVSHRFWVSRLGGERDVLGRTLTIDGRSYQVAGVMPRGFELPAGAQLWQVTPPVSLAEGSPSAFYGRYWLVGRLAPGVSLDQAHAILSSRFAAYAFDEPAFTGWVPRLSPLPDELIGPVRKPLLLLLGAVVLVLLIACANVAAVLLARGAQRRREFAVRISLGASRWRVARQLLTESVLLAMASGLAGVIIALWAVPLVVTLAGDQLPRATEIRIDWRILGGAVFASTSIGILAGLLPALLTVRRDVSEALKDGGQSIPAGSWRIRIGEALVVLQIGLGTLLLTGAALLATSFVNLSRVDFGFEPSRAVAAQIVLTGERYASAEQRQTFAAQVLERASALPGVEAAAVSTGIPFRGGAIGSIGIPGEEAPPDWAWITEATPRYFRTVGIRVLRGRALQDGDRGGNAVLVNQQFARTFFPGQEPIGRSITFYGNVTGIIVGVVNDTRQRTVGEDPPPHIYGPFTDGQLLHFSVRSGEGAALAASALQSVIREIDPTLPIDRAGPLSDLVAESVARERFYAVVLTTSALIALLITSLGVFGLTSYSVARRMHEMGVRVALGATAGHIRSITVGRTTVLAGLGIVLGTIGTLTTSHLLDALLYGLTATDPRVLGAVAVLLAGIAVLAAYPSVRRATRVDPMIVLQAE
jgi:putative ABC transport system permease protein